MKKILLTGGSGFIGRNIRESYLAEKYEIIAPNHAELDLVDSNSVKQFFLRKHFDVVFHTAVKPSHRAAKDPTRILIDNLRMFHNLTREADRFGRMILTGSGSVYDMSHYRPQMKEDSVDDYVPVDDLGLYKYTVWKLIENDNKYVDLRIFGIYGKYEDFSIRFISNMICKALYDMPLTMNQDRRFDYLWIDDLMPILDKFIDCENAHGAYNATSGNVHFLSEIAQMILEATGKNLPVEIKTPGLGPEYSGDNAKLRDFFPDLRFTSLPFGIEQLVQYYRRVLSEIDTAALVRDR
jgi:Nucleoside-diphosphate-sugar epimerases